MNLLAIFAGLVFEDKQIRHIEYMTFMHPPHISCRYPAVKNLNKSIFKKDRRRQTNSTRYFKNYGKRKLNNQKAAELRKFLLTRTLSLTANFL